jgi:hypothetical protein
VRPSDGRIEDVHAVGILAALAAGCGIAAAEDHGGDLLVSAKLGLALVAWLEDQPGSGRRVVDLHTECLRVLYPSGPVRAEWPEPPSDDWRADWRS